MKIELYHASKYGNGAKVADEFKRVMEARGHQVNVYHIDEASVKALPPADLYVFGSPTRFGGPIGAMRRFIKKVDLPPGTKYALFATHGGVAPNKKTGRMPTEEEVNRERKTIPVLEGILAEKGLVKVADAIFTVVPTTLKGPLEEGWKEKVEGFAARIAP
ncbi:MAG: hypothetical protein ISF22_07080 [Methanomassiliicoccus sp.]|nr:hypothetical protein [Methanomassiliicoccus sp.]